MIQIEKQQNRKLPEHLSREELLRIVEELQQENNELKQRARLAEIMNDTSIDRIMAIDTDMQVIAWNRTCEQIFEVSKEDILGKNLITAFPALEDNTEVMIAMQRALGGYNIFLPSGSATYDGTYSESHFVPLRNDENEVIGVLCIIHDVAHRVKTEQELKALNKALVRKNAELKQRNHELLGFSQVTGHDLKEPLRKIYLFIEMLLEQEFGKLSNEGKTYFKRIQASVQRMSLLTDDILSYAQLHNDRGEFRKINLEKVVKTALVQLQSTISATHAVVHIGKLTTVKGDEHLLTLLFRHLISNSLKFITPGQKPEITIDGEIVSGKDIPHPDTQADQEYARVSITDNGIGFEKKYANKIFEMFQRLHNRDEFGGTGMGLAICKKVATTHSGFILCDSTPEKGSAFDIYLPISLNR